MRDFSKNDFRCADVCRFNHEALLLEGVSRDRHLVAGQSLHSLEAHLP